MILVASALILSPSEINAERAVIVCESSFAIAGEDADPVNCSERGSNHATLRFAVSPLLIHVNTIGINFCGAPGLSSLRFRYAAIIHPVLVFEGKDARLVRIISRLCQAFVWKYMTIKVCADSLLEYCRDHYLILRWVQTSSS